MSKRSFGLSFASSALLQKRLCMRMKPTLERPSCARGLRASVTFGDQGRFLLGQTHYERPIGHSRIRAIKIPVASWSDPSGSLRRSGPAARSTCRRRCSGTNLHICRGWFQQCTWLQRWPRGRDASMAQQLSEAQLFDCCASRTFAARVAARLAAGDGLGAVVAAARSVWWHETSVAGWLEAFGAHPRIGDATTLKAKLGGFADMSRHEQAAAADAPDEVFQDLADWNKQYEAKFGHVFLISAAGKTAPQILASLKARHESPPHEELLQAAAQQMAITERRIAALLGPAPAPTPPAGTAQPVTSHVLDTALGRPAEGVLVTLQKAAPGSPGPASAVKKAPSPAKAGKAGVWEIIAQQRTNSDGRVPGLMAPSDTLPQGRYRVVFGTEEYMASCRARHPGVWPQETFYPTAAVVFTCAPDQVHEHFHIPLTWNPYGYSTYRGS